MAKELHMVEGFGCRPKNMYDALTDGRCVSMYTQSPAVIEAKEGGEFSMFGGSIHGTFEELVPNEKIVQKWRFKEWEEGHFSIVTITLSEGKRGVTKLKLDQTGIPLADKFGNPDVPEKVKSGWERFFWDRIHKMMGYHKEEVY
mmetsp:Transcript_2587/g.3038  ORF Transcript_2587/g.3038 Transcript_2587/m.3038 type:complete len:144 (+) Transcript_2587:27-458(+)|eukprot:CAMPEP_0205825562 /NCGR_PEP_ID=MMETSP0206-20130828/25712_1 /ASSEMBLY_ACC=CAM_ASM_000279 /TAXON_ID=36767 /ORGANISM="Euplotes focardii, Strain TN1" /LENGTH=143 /DNA_ID=CAMNT_0053124719 /DNA_START=23 /DNA_END=454 /DNA_ORIENTATION=+